MRSVAAQGGQPALRKVAGVAAQQRQVRDDAQRGEIGVLCRLLATARPVVQRLAQLVRHADAGQVEQGDAGSPASGLDSRPRAASD